MPMPMYFPEKYPQTWICCSQTGGNFLLAKVGEALYNNPCFRAISSAEVALPSHGRGHWFDPSIAHQVISRVPAVSSEPFFFTRTPPGLPKKTGLKNPSPGHSRRTFGSIFDFALFRLFLPPRRRHPKVYILEFGGTQI